jgi:hypothetical protein
MKEAIYGFPCVEDPNDFTPDAECCTPEEIAFWEDAKKRWEAGERDVRGARCEWLSESVDVTRTSWGIGVNMVEMEDEGLGGDADEYNDLDTDCGEIDPL